MKLVYILLIIFTSALKAFAAETVFVNALKVKIYSEAKSSSSVLAESNRGDSLTVSGADGNWLHVSVKGQTGWISKLFTSKTPPLKSDDLSKFNSLDKDKVGRVRLNYENKGAARGLTDSGPRVSRNSYESDQKKYEAIQFIENQKTDADTIKKFQNEGKLKP